MNEEYRKEFSSAQQDAYWSLPRVAMFVVILMILMYAFGFLATGGNLAIYRFWAPKQENAKRVVFENTQSYVQGKVEYLSRLRFQYQGAEGDQKAALRTLILSEASTVDSDKLPTGLQSFLVSLEGAQ